MSKGEMKFKDFFFAALNACSILLVLIVCKIKLVLGNETLHVLSENSLKDSMFFSLPLFVNPVCYYDDLTLSIGIFLFLIFVFSFKKNIANLIAIVFCYSIGAYSIIGQIFLYKYGVPFTPELFYHIGGIFELRTSIEHEVGENFRLIVAFFVLFIILILIPKSVMLIVAKPGKNLINKPVSNTAAYLSAFLCVSVLFCFLRIGIKGPPELQFHISNPPINLIRWYRSEIINAGSVFCENCIINDQVDISNSVKAFSDFQFKKRKRNIILIILETTIGKYFDPVPDRKRFLPNISKMAESSIQILKYYSPGPKSTKAFFSILTGYYPLLDYRFYVRLYPESEIPDFFTIMKENDYKTFVGYSGDLKYDNMKSYLCSRNVDKLVDISSNKGQYEANSWCTDDKMIYDAFIEWVDGNNMDDLFFSVFITMNSHHPFWTPKHYEKKLPKDLALGRYERAMHYQDFLIGTLFDYLEKAKKLDNTVIVITGDHGGIYQLAEKFDNSSKIDMVHRVPFFVFSKEFFFGPIVNDSLPVIHADILPTILDVSGIEYENNFEGRSIFDDKINSRLIFLLNDYYKKSLISIFDECYFASISDGMSVKTMKSIDGDPAHCMGNTKLVEIMKTRTEKFLKFHDRNILKFTKSSGAKQ